MSDVKLRIKLDHTEPVDLLYFTDSLINLNKEYKKFLYRNKLSYDEESRLYIKQIESGSIITELIDLVPVVAAGAQLIGEKPQILLFAEFLAGSLKYFSSNQNQPNEQIEQVLTDKQSLSNQKNFLNQVTQNGDNSSIHITVNNIQTDQVLLNETFTNQQAHAAQNRIEKEIRKLETKEQKVLRDMVLYFTKITKDADTKGDYGVIEQITEKSLKIIWQNDTKGSVIKMEQNPFNVFLQVDVVLETVRGKPVAYKIFEVVDIVDIDN